MSPDAVDTVRTAVIGVGYLGALHAEKLATLDYSKLVAVADSDPQTAQRVAQKLGVAALTDYRALFGQVDAVSIAVPTQQHYPVAKECLEHDIHVLLEKPIAASLEQAQALVELAERRQRVLQIGHLERFNPAVLALDGIVNQPLFIETHRLTPFRPRGIDTSVVLDLMIHDIDLILNLVQAPLERIDASGVPVLSPDIDIANARLQFANGCVANVTASRVSLKAERKMRLFQRDAYLSIDFQHKKLGIYRRGDGECYPGFKDIIGEERVFAESDALKAEIAAFLTAVRTGARPVVNGEDGRRALATAMEIMRLLNQNPLWPMTSSSTPEPH